MSHDIEITEKTRLPIINMDLVYDHKTDDVRRYFEFVLPGVDSPSIWSFDRDTLRMWLNAAISFLDATDQQIDLCDVHDENQPCEAFKGTQIPSCGNLANKVTFMPLYGLVPTCEQCRNFFKYGQVPIEFSNMKVSVANNG